MRPSSRRRRRAPEIRVFDAENRARELDAISAEGRRVLLAAQAVLRAAGEPRLGEGG